MPRGQQILMPSLSFGEVPIKLMRSIPHPIRRIAVAGAAVLVLGGAAVGIAAAQTQPTATPASQSQTGYQRFVDALAKRLNVSSQTLETAVTQARQDAGLPANAQGFPGGAGRRGPRGFGGDLNAAATALGITSQQLEQELPGKSLAQVAQAHGKTAADVATALKNAAHQRIDTAVSNGKLPADQATTQKTQVDQRIDQMVNQVKPQGGPGGGEGFGGRGAFRVGLDTAATTIGITSDQLRQELSGKSLAQVAQAHGKTANDVATALKNAAHQRIDTAVTNGKLPADQATTQKTQADQRIDQLVNQVTPQRPAGAPGA
jgi:polyhydroxyalkanoate synthesis regulator phasin